MKRVYFNADGFDNIQFVRIFHSNTISGSFLHLQDIPYNPSFDYVDVDSDSYYFKVAFIIGGKQTELSGAVIPEDIGRIINIVSTDLGDINRDDPAFSEEEYVMKIRLAVKILKGVETVSTLSDSDMDIICKLVMKSCCYVLAYDNARYTKLTLPDGISLSKGDRVAQYLAIVKALENEISYLLNVFGGNATDGEGNTFSVISTTRQTYFKDSTKRYNF